MGRYLLRELPKTALRLAIAIALFGTVTQIQWPGLLGRWIGLLAGAALAAAVLIICGALLYNTLFYERYWRQVDTR